jgi:hypothetical protein
LNGLISSHGNNGEGDGGGGSGGSIYIDTVDIKLVAVNTDPT